MSEQRVSCTIDAGIADVRLDRPDKHNGLDPAMFDAIVGVGERLRSETSVRAVILSGNGPSFCSGLDFRAFMAGGPAVQGKLLTRPSAPAGPNKSPDRIDNLAQRLAWVWTEVPAPVIAAVHGACIGGGLQLALAADIRIVHPDARLAVREIHYGMIPDMSISRTLARLVPIDIAKLLTFTGRDVPGTEALALGLATLLHDDPLAAARSLAEQIAGHSPHAIRAAKQLWNRAPVLDDEASLRLETELQVGLLGTRNQLEAVQARFMNRTPRFEDPKA